MSNPVFSETTFEKAGYSPNADHMTVNGSIMKTFILGLVFIMTSFAVIAYAPNFYGSIREVIIVSVIAAFVVGMIISFKPTTAPVLSVVYAVLESIFVTVLSILLNQQYNGIVFEAVTYTMIAFFTMLILYRISIGINAVIIVVAALNLILDFDFIEKGSSMQMPKYMEWYAAFGLIVTIIWLYLEILRILSKIKSR